MSEHFAADSTVGAIEIGALISIFLFGLVTVQTYTYLQRYPNDSPAIRLLVGAVWLGELAHTALTCASVYTMTVTLYGEPEKLDKVPPALSTVIVLSGIIGPVIQAFFANRVRKLSGSWTIAVITWILCLLRLVGMMGISAASYTMTNLTQFKKQWRWLMILTLSVSAVVDIIIAGSLCLFLWRKRNAAFESTSRMVDRLIAWTIQTGLLTSVTTVLMLICFLTMDNFAWLGIIFILSRFFSNSLLASLNARVVLRNLSSEPKTSFLDIRSRDSNMRSPQHGQFPPAISIEMVKTREVMTDNSDPMRDSFEHDLEGGLQNVRRTKV